METLTIICNYLWLALKILILLILIFVIIQTLFEEIFTKKHKKNKDNEEED